MTKDSFKEDDYPLGVELTEKLRQQADRRVACGSLVCLS